MADEKDTEKLRKRITDAMEDADLAYWAEIVKHFPEVKTGDFGPDDTIAWRNAQENALLTWLIWNHPNEKLIERLYKHRRIGREV